MDMSQAGESVVPLCSGVAEIPEKPVSMLLLASLGGKAQPTCLVLQYQLLLSTSAAGRMSQRGAGTQQ